MPKAQYSYGRTAKKPDTIDGVLTIPPPEVAEKPVKPIVFPHGGPHSRAGRGFHFAAQLFASRGYAVFQPNFRGTSGIFSVAGSSTTGIPSRALVLQPGCYSQARVAARHCRRPHTRTVTSALASMASVAGSETAAEERA